MRLRTGSDPKPALIESVDEGSPLYGMVEPGDRLISINGRRPRDLIEYLSEQSEDPVTLLFQTGRGELRARPSRRPGEGLGLTFAEPVFDGLRTCRNACVFCFVDRMPPGLRPSLYVKDDDWRLSVLSGSFITLNNLGREDLKRILGLRLQPLYVSLHAADPALRDRMMGGRSSAGALKLLRKLVGGGIEVHLQVVLCPGYNDGERLSETLSGILGSFPAASAGIVPVGVTGGYGRKGVIRPVRVDDASRVLEMVASFQAEALRRYGRRLFYAADEFYILAGAPFPAAEEYEGYPQLENGIGMARDFIDDAGEALKEQGTPHPAQRTAVLTGELGAVVLKEALRAAGSSLEGPDIRPVKNGLFGPDVTVTGLVAGEDILREIRSLEGYGRILVPSVMLREGEYLDSVNINRVREAAGIPVRFVETDGASLVRALRQVGEGS